MKDYKTLWRKKARKLLAEAFGGKCTICGYDKTTAALDYHHIDKKTKNKELSIAMKNGHAWSSIVEEARKCTIVCCRCHREIHEGIAVLPENYAKFNEEYSDLIKLKEKEYDACPICLKQKWKGQKFCSKECSSSSQQRFEITREEMLELLKTETVVAIGKKFGVTSQAIKKRCERLGIVWEDRRSKFSGKKFTKEQLKNRESFAKSMTEPLLTKEEMKKKHEEFQKVMKETYG